MTRMQRKAKAIDEEYRKLLDAENQQHEEDCFDDLDQDVFNLKHREHSWLKEAAHKSSKSSRCSRSKRSSSSRSSASNKSSGSSRSSTKLKLLKEKARIAELEAEATLLMEQQKAETQAKMFQLQREVVRAKARAQVYAGYIKDDEAKTYIMEAKIKDEVTLSSVCRVH